MAITAHELTEKRKLIIPGLEFQIPSHDKTSLHTIRVTQVSTVDKTSCWGDYQQDRVWFELKYPKAKQIIKTFQRKDGTEYLDFVMVTVPGEFGTETNSLRIDCFIEYKFNKKTTTGVLSNVS